MNDTPTDPAQEPVLYCANHPHTETTLRCNRCEKPICAKCAVLTPTGYRCKECVRGQQKVFDTSQAQDYLIAVPLAGVLSFIAGLIASNISFFVIFLAPAVGGIIAEIVRRVIQKRRGKRLFQAIAAAIAIGGLLPLCSALLFGNGGFFNLSLIWSGVYVFMATSTAYYRLSGIQI